jgi:hypothetical protein
VNDLAHRLDVRQRVDVVQRVLAAGALPIRGQLIAVKLRPLADEAQGRSRQRALQHVQRVDRDRSVVLRVAGMEVGDAVLAVVHRQLGDSVEGTDARHRGDSLISSGSGSGSWTVRLALVGGEGRRRRGCGCKTQNGTARRPGGLWGGGGGSVVACPSPTLALLPALSLEHRLGVVELAVLSGEF